MFLKPLLMYFRCYGNFKFPLTFNGKIENWHKLLSLFRYFDKRFTEIPLPIISFLFKIQDLIGCHGNRKAKFVKKIFKKSSPPKPEGG